MMETAGYSGTPLAKKLGIKEGYTIRLVNPPDYYFQLFSDLPPGINVIPHLKTKKDFIHFFAKTVTELHNNLPTMRQEIEQNGIIWISWPKKSSKVQTELNGNTVREIGLKYGLVDIKVCAVDEIWSGLKFVIPVKDRK
ncbi:DUF3052 domain-containing protein [Arenibacter sp. M-2]|uniref:DUF3052 domain-containing protein n=1 Tax=Arenibacter sp. M-2 TaxID=3053612 RepID=UPI002570E054|nr:DUF3052 domain-containing protein [Arenibacter sp. M-2]MDL5510611.1 DUF3052 domain-containing protein [Arenibacter sp. M-2]|tara:strand:- start:26927 stop:27343 length:417 start_codon:yes stop_codon:yes gene_type:complete